MSLEELNDSELVALARLNGLDGATRGVPRYVLIDCLLTMQDIPINSQIRSIALTMEGWLREWWDRLQEVAPKKCCPRCSGCTDLQVLKCYARDREQIVATAKKVMAKKGGP